MTEQKEVTGEELIGDLVVSVLSVNLWTIEKTFKIYDGLREEGLFDFDAVAALPETEVFARLERAGYTRGDFMVGMLAGRLRSVALALSGQGQEKLRQLVTAKDRKGVEALLQPIKGIGPSVIANYLALRGIGAEQG